MKNKNMFFLAFGVILLLALGLSYIYSARYGESKAGRSIEIVYNGESKILKSKDILLADKFSFTHKTKKSNGEDVSKDYTGVDIKTILTMADIDIGKLQKLTFISADDFVVEVVPEEFNQNENVYIAHTIGDKLIFDMDMAIDPSKVGGKEILDCYNLVIRSDHNSKRVGRYISKIIVE